MMLVVREVRLKTLEYVRMVCQVTGLKSNLKCVMVNILVDIELGKRIKCVCERKSIRNTFCAIYWEKMSSSNNSVEVDNRGKGFIVVWLDNPHACVVVWRITHT
jgi:hypothetical protein